MALETAMQKRYLWKPPHRAGEDAILEGNEAYSPMKMEDDE